GLPALCRFRKILATNLGSQFRRSDRWSITVIKTQFAPMYSSNFGFTGAMNLFSNRSGSSDGKRRNWRVPPTKLTNRSAESELVESIPGRRRYEEHWKVVSRAHLRKCAYFSSTIPDIHVNPLPDFPA